MGCLGSSGKEFWHAGTRASRLDARYPDCEPPSECKLSVGLSGRGEKKNPTAVNGCRAGFLQARPTGLEPGTARRVVTTGSTGAFGRSLGLGIYLSSLAICGEKQTASDSRKFYTNLQRLLKIP